MMVAIGILVLLAALGALNWWLKGRERPGPGASQPYQSRTWSHIMPPTDRRDGPE